MGDLIKDLVNSLTRPVPYFFGGAIALFLVLRFRRVSTKPILITAFFALGTVFFLWAWKDPNFNKIVTKPDNVPIIMLLGSVVYFSWLSLRRGYLNDERTRAGQPTLEGELSKQKVFVWPDLVYIELICLIAFSAFLIAWSILIEAPIEEYAATARTPNPSKAPWYFLGLQELLVYFDPWIAGVLLPGYIIVGLMAVPYLDVNPKGNGYYTFEERPFAISFFWVGFVLFWVSFVILGTFLRGPNWSFFGPFEYWNLHKLEPMVNVDLSTYFWVGMLGVPRPASPLLREAPGIALILGYFLVVPKLLEQPLLKALYDGKREHLIRYHTFMHFLLWFGLLPIKMLLRWTVNLKYFVGIPEWFFNI